MTAIATLVASIPSPPWNSLEIGPLNLRFYGLMIAFGVIAAVWLFGRQLESHRLGTTDDAGSVAVWGVVAGVIGARLYHVITDWSRFSDDLGSIPKIWEGGLGIPGGLIAGIAAGAYQARRRGIRPTVAMTFAAPAIALAQAIGRWGNWFNQELYGKPTDLPWGLEIDDAHLPAGSVSGTTFHPTFLYESLWNVVLCVVLLRVQRRFRLGPGRLLAVYAIGYGVGRFWVEGLRIDPATDVAGMRWNQWMALIAVAVGVAALVVTRGRTWDAAAVRTSSTREPGGSSVDAGDPMLVGAVAVADDREHDGPQFDEAVTGTADHTVDTINTIDATPDAESFDAGSSDASSFDAGSFDGGDGGGGGSD
jgi:prolipoprotein diacylglyceryl transferase